MYSKKILCAASLFALSYAAHADNFSVDLSTFATTSPYRGTDAKVRVFPYVRYDSDRFFFRGFGGGIHLWKNQQQEFNLIANYYFPIQFRPRDTDNSQLKRLDSRQATLMAGVGYTLRTDNIGTFSASLTADTLSRSQGLSSDINYKYPMKRDGFTLIPGVGALWNSSKQNDYYYGVSQRESARSGLAAYEADSGFSPYAEITAVFPLTQKLHVSTTAKYLHFSDGIKNSPMVSKSGAAAAGVSMGYDF